MLVDLTEENALKFQFWVKIDKKYALVESNLHKNTNFQFIFWIKKLFLNILKCRAIFV